MPIGITFFVTQHGHACCIEIPYYHIDAFTSTLFAGNPAGICLLKSWPDDTPLQAIAGEYQLSETAFLVGSGSEYELRWFTPATEVDLCGHATLAASFVLYRQPGADRGPLLFHSHSGELLVSRDEGKRVKIGGQATQYMTGTLHIPDLEVIRK